MVLWVDKHRPTSFGELTAHARITARMKQLVRALLAEAARARRGGGGGGPLACAEERCLAGSDLRASGPRR
jgi:hypothetical protein